MAGLDKPGRPTTWRDNMQRSDYIIRRAGFVFFILAVTIVFNFFLFRIMPGDPVQLIVSPRLPGEAREKS